MYLCINVFISLVKHFKDQSKRPLENSSASLNIRFHLMILMYQWVYSWDGCTVHWQKHTCIYQRKLGANSRRQIWYKNIYISVEIIYILFPFVVKIEIQKWNMWQSCQIRRSFPCPKHFLLKRGKLYCEFTNCLFFWIWTGTFSLLRIKSRFISKLYK